MSQQNNNLVNNVFYKVTYENHYDGDDDYSHYLGSEYDDFDDYENALKFYNRIKEKYDVVDLYKITKESLMFKNEPCKHNFVDRTSYGIDVDGEYLDRKFMCDKCCLTEERGRDYIQVKTKIV